MGGRLQWLEAMRALAAIWVVVYHGNLSVTAFLGPVSQGRAFLANGYLGVDFFFVLSGFIIAFSTQRLIDAGRGWKDYASARTIRIYVPYLPIGVTMLAFYLLFPDVGDGAREPGIVSSLTLLPLPSPPALSVAWSLVHEIIFYAVFSLIFLSRALLACAIISWVAFIGAWELLADGVVPGWWFLANPVNLCFFLGVALYYATKNGVSGSVALVAGCLSLVTLATQVAANDPNRLFLAIGFGGLIVVAISDKAQRLGPGRILVFLGAASYSIYLIHNPLHSVSVRLFRRWAPNISPELILLLMTLIAIIGAVGYHLLYERRALALAKVKAKEWLRPCDSGPSLGSQAEARDRLEAR